MDMTFKELMEKLNIKSCPPRWETIYGRAMESYTVNGVPYIKKEYIDDLNSKYGLFKKYYESVMEGAERALEMDLLLRYIVLLVEAMKDRKEFIPEIAQIEVPEPLDEKDGPAYRFILLFALLPFIEGAAEKMRARGVGEEMILETLKSYEISMDNTFLKTGSPGLSFGYIRWFQHYIDAIILKVGCLVFNVKYEFDGNVNVFRNKRGDIKMLLKDVTLYEGGLVFGSAGLGDESKSYPASYKETNEYFEGYEPLERGYASTDTVRLKKSEWGQVLGRREPMISVHIPSSRHGGRLSRERLDESYRQAREVFSRCFPEYDFRGFCCTTWLLDPKLEDFLSPHSGILNFQRAFMRYPRQSAGKSVFSFVFLKPFEKYEDLPETTSLMSAIKNHYLEGGFIYDFGGVILF